MRIDDRNLTTVPAESGRAQEAQRVGREDGLRSDSGTGSGSGDQVELSSTLGSLSRALAAYGSSRQSQVAALAAQYQSGKYQPDSMATSRGMISEALAAGSK
ncbi:MAG TPA: flagellar biosynthesis anti-sigma factor FlgM [Bryobacteraceae bacterium]|nr:flagellar biosynthesis anti-sigma factor FlgM [Bryobacteraceae bacterium]